MANTCYYATNFVSEEAGRRTQTLQATVIAYELQQDHDVGVW